MKKNVIAISALLVLLLSACQATPSQSIVKEKNLDNMIEEATKTQSPSATTGEQGDTLEQKMSAPATCQEELVDATGKVRIHVNADVEIPDVSGVSVERVEQAQITQEQVDTLVQHLMKGDLFSGNDYKPSKSEIQTQILQIQAAIARGDDNTSVSPKLKGKSAISWLQPQLDQLQADLQSAPDQSVKTPISSKFAAISPDDGGGEELYALSQPAPDVFQSFHAYNYSDGSSLLRFSSEKNAFSKTITSNYATKESIESALNQGQSSLMTQEELDAIPDIGITKEGAQKTADDIVAALGLNDFMCISADKEYGGSSDMTADMSTYVNPRKCVWFLRYARSVNGVPVTHTVYDCGKVETEQQSQPWSYEDITFAIDDSGVVGFEWKSPHRVSGMVTENSNILSFQDAKNVFDTMALVQTAWDGLVQGSSLDITGFDINVNHIVFGLTRVTEQNKRNSGLLVPCWDFFANSTYTANENGKKVTKQYESGYPLLTINAIDGSVINRSLGY